MARPDSDQLTRAVADRRSGLMPIEIQRRDDGDALWTAFRRCHYLSWTGRDVNQFVLGWDSRAALDETQLRSEGDR